MWNYVPSYSPAVLPYDGHRKRGARRVPFNNYLQPNLPVQMSKALGISGFAFPNAAETERLTKPDCSKFHTMELLFPSLTHSLTQSLTQTKPLFEGYE